MSDYQNLLTSLDERGVQILTINRPAKLNALNHETLGEIQQAVEQAIANPAVRAIIVTGAGEKAFIAGADIAEIQQLTPESSVPFIKRGQMVCDLIQNCPKPIIAAVNGFALGGGTEVAMACHIRVASENARFGLPEVGLGIMPGYGGTQRLAQLVGRGRALEYMFTGKQIPAAEAYRVGLANHVVAPSELMPFCQSMLDSMLSKSLTSIANVVTAVNAYFSKPETGYQVEAEAFRKCCATPDFHEGTAAFVEKRKPIFSA